jgi:hypothetical protein
MMMGMVYILNGLTGWVDLLASGLCYRMDKWSHNLRTGLYGGVYHSRSLNKLVQGEQIILSKSKRKVDYLPTEMQDQLMKFAGAISSSGLTVEEFISSYQTTFKDTKPPPD